MKPEVHLLGISIKTFGVTFALGFLACGLVVAAGCANWAGPWTGHMRSCSRRCSAA